MRPEDGVFNVPLGLLTAATAEPLIEPGPRIVARSGIEPPPLPYESRTHPMERA